jgi:hypothetical protein
MNSVAGGVSPHDLLNLAAESINGIRNRQAYGGRLQQADPEFQPAIEALAKGLMTGQISWRAARVDGKTGADPNIPPDVLLTIHDRGVPPDVALELAQLRQMLRLDPQVREFKLVNEVLPLAKDEIAFRTRSALRVMTYLSLNVEVPLAHLAEGRAPDQSDPSPDPNPPFLVHSGCERPDDCYAAVHYQGYWFWIEHSDLNSKRSMAYLKHLLARADTSQKPAGPVLTIRAND